MTSEDKSVPAANGARVTGASDEGWPSERRFWGWTALGLSALAFGKGMRLPGAWAYTQAQINYSSGFIRRGLFGSVFDHLLGLNRYAHFAAVSTALLLLLYAVLVLLARLSQLTERTQAGELLAVYASSFSVSYLAHLNGYLDIPLALLCAGPLFIRHTGWRLGACLAATIVGLLFHEQFFFAFVPMLVVSVAFGATTSQTVRGKQAAFAGAVLLALVGASFTWYLGRYASVSEAQTQQLANSASRLADRPLVPGVFEVLPRTPQQNLQIMESVWRRPTFIPAQIESLLIFGPTAGVLSWATLLLLRRWRPIEHRWLFAGTLVGTLAPLSLNFFGWDKNRWNELLCLNALLMLLFVTRMFGREAVAIPLWMRRTCLLVMLLNMATGGGLMENLHIRPFPFLRNPDAATAIER